MFRNVAFRIVAGLVLLAVIAAIAFFVFQAGTNYGAAANLPVTGEGTVMPFHPYFGMHPFFGFGFFGLLFVFFLIAAAFGAMRRLFWGPRWGWRHMGHGPMGRGSWEDGVPPMFAEWHKRAHEEPAGKKGTE